ncbi:MAG: prepilin-type N-terminal cleavage/methylation domain-containing protein [Planctomycetes bacterium]|nr:prepilin-type N-terminal cleavage/methylation domain-containing protein [Planctomycetota bacterium]
MNGRRAQGFTLVELLVVISIIGILSGIIIPVTSIARRKVREMATKAEIQSLQTAAAAFMADSGQYPPDLYVNVRNMNGVRLVFGAIAFRPAYQLNNVSSRASIKINDSTKTLVFWLGSRFDIMGKYYGPYTTFSLNRLVLLNPGDHVPRWISYGRRGTIEGIRGIGDDLTNEIYLRSLKDHFDTCYVYDCHNPEGQKIQEEGYNAKAHNMTTFDLWSCGYDRTPFMSGSKEGGSEPDRGLARTVPEERQAQRYGNDITNWY